MRFSFETPVNYTEETSSGHSELKLTLTLLSFQGLIKVVWNKPTTRLHLSNENKSKLESLPDRASLDIIS
jgi:hypothetical protein